jgi:hypothetical protein
MGFKLQLLPKMVAEEGGGKLSLRCPYMGQRGRQQVKNARSVQCTESNIEGLIEVST